MNEWNEKEHTSGYWKVWPKNRNISLGGGWSAYGFSESVNFEIVYLFFDGKFSVIRMGQSQAEPVENFLWVKKYED